VIYLGIDPSQRHTGLAIQSKGSEPLFFEVQTGTDDLLTSMRRTRDDLMVILDRHCPSGGTIYSIERQLTQGHSSAALAAVFMAILDAIHEWDPEPRAILMPLPVQLISYLKRQHGVDTTSASTIVQHFKQTRGYKGTISQHKVDAYYLGRLAADVMTGRWRYNLPTKERPLVPWRITNGD
jgi:hypothetical protein